MDLNREMKFFSLLGIYSQASVRKIYKSGKKKKKSDICIIKELQTIEIVEHWWRERQVAQEFLKTHSGQDYTLGGL